MTKNKIVSALLAVQMVLSSISMLSASALARVSVHDPSIIKDPKTGTYYVYGSHVEAAKSNNLQDWYRFTNGYTTPKNVEFGDMSANLKKAFDWSGENLEDCVNGFAVWAPDVIWNPDYVNTDGSKGAYVMYFCTSSTYIRSVICYAVSKNIEGPFQFVDTLIYTGFTANDQYVTSSTKNVNKKYTSTNIDELIASGEVTYNKNWFSGNNYNNNLFPNAIDPTIYYGTDGKMYMTYGSWSGGIFTLEIDKKTGKVIHPKSGTTSDGRMIDSYFGTKLVGSYHKSGEAPFIEYNKETGYYYLWVTFGGLFSDGGYNMRVYRSKSPTGPFVDPSGKSGIQTATSNLDDYGLKVMGNYKFSTQDRAYMACGHNSVLQDDDGNWYLFYHARFDDGTEYHEVRVHSMQFNSEGWPVVAPNEYQGDKIDAGGYEISDIAGTYEYINHGNDTSKKIYNASTITLTADGKISGAVSGTWSEASGSNDAVIKIGNQIYYGKFLAAKDEKGKKVMSFTAVGSNNQTIWGNQTKAFTGTPRAGGYSAANFAEGSVFTIKNVNSGLYMEVAGNEAANNTNVQQWDLNGGDTEATNTPDTWNMWRLFNAGDGYYYILSEVGDGATYALDIAGKKSDNGTNIGIYQFNGNDNQKFKLTKNADGSYKIRTKVSGDKSAVEVESGSSEYGANIQEWEVNGANCQDWLLESAQDPGLEMNTDVLYTFKNVNSGFVMDIADGKMEDNSNVQQWESNGFDCQKWKLVPFKQGGNYYYIRSASDENYVLRSDGAENGGNLSIQTYSGKDSAMLFKFAKNPDGSYKIMTRSSKDAKVLEVSGASTEYGANIQQWEVNGNNCQKWNAETEAIATTTITQATTTTTTSTTTETTATTTEPLPSSVIADVTADGKFDTADIIAVQRWLHNDGTHLNNWKAADLNSDGILNVIDLALMKKTLFKK